MPSQILTVTLQAALFSALSTVLAQSITAYQHHSQSQSQSLHSPSSNSTSSPLHTRSVPSAIDSLLHTFNLPTLLTFIVIAIIMTPPNYLLQRSLEDTFPSKVAVKAAGTRARNGETKEKQVSERLSKSNTLAKFCLDQSLGAMANTAGFIVLAGLAKGKGVNAVFGSGGDLQRDFLPMLLASWRVWPTVTLLNLCVVPFDYRMIVGNLVGVCWGVYVTLQTM